LAIFLGEEGSAAQSLAEASMKTIAGADLFYSDFTDPQGPLLTSAPFHIA
jgi:hypothetical protein